MNIISKWLTVLALLTSPVVANAALVSLTQDGDVMVSDSALNVTWADIESPLLLVSDGRGPNAVLSWQAAQAWVGSLNTMINSNGSVGYGGYSNWTLPTATGSNFISNPPSANQLGELFFVELGNQPGTEVTNLGPFTSISSAWVYWSGTQVYSLGSPYPEPYAYFDALYGDENAGGWDANLNFRALAVRSDTPVPLPASAWLTLSGLGGIGAMFRRRRGQSVPFKTALANDRAIPPSRWAAGPSR